MLSDEQLEDILYHLSFSLEWFSEVFKKSDLTGNSLMMLPQSYLDKVKTFISSHSMDELEGFSPKDFVEQSTGLELGLVSKLVENEKRKHELEKDFI